MAILAELFLVLAGFASGISQEREVHPAEKDVFERASAFGELVAATSRAASDRLDHPACRVIKREIVLRYLEELAELENTVIGQVADLRIKSVNGTLSDSLFYSTKILALTVDAWTPAFDFAGQLLSNIDDPKNVQTKWVLNFILESAGVPKMQGLATAVLSEMDRSWLNELRVMVAEGSNCPPELLKHPQAPHADLVNGLTQAMRELNAAADSNPGLLDDVLNLIDANESILVERVAIPLDKVQCTHVFDEINANVHRAVRDHFLKSREVTSMVELLRAVVLLGSASFITAYCDAQGDLNSCLRNFLEMDDELSTDASQLGPTLLAPSTSKTGNELRLSIYGPLTFMFSAEQCVIYESMFDWLSKVALASGSIGIGAGSTAHAYKLLFNMIWSYYQNRIDAAFDKLKAVMESPAGLNVRGEQDLILRNLVTQLFLDSKDYRNLLRSAVTGCQHSDLRPLRDLVLELRNLSELHDIDLRPFDKYL